MPKMPSLIVISQPARLFLIPHLFLILLKRLLRVWFSKLEMLSQTMLPFLPIKTDLAAESRLPDFLTVLMMVLKMWTRGLSYAQNEVYEPAILFITPQDWPTEVESRLSEMLPFHLPSGENANSTSH